ncbi:hypothetical protein TIFTF001_007239 [Ficus carica]|uniref:Uncharacterized protein n=1 Tax=Ficus carica TaxID=3494 RepID=A0AA87ZPZ1_FICCA|nr:hypothetical protein TIFTF001_007239 [Ficus carica]
MRPVDLELCDGSDLRAPQASISGITTSPSSQGCRTPLRISPATLKSSLETGSATRRKLRFYGDFGRDSLAAILETFSGKFPTIRGGCC